MKAYVKPELCYENFELNMSVAANCAMNASHVVINTARYNQIVDALVSEGLTIDTVDDVYGYYGDNIVSNS